MKEYIEREAAEDVIIGRVEWFDWEVKASIRAIPAADVVPVRHGRWDSSRPDAPMFGFHFCSLCGRKRTSPQDNYCPNCGARMDGDGE